MERAAHLAAVAAVALVMVSCDPGGATAPDASRAVEDRVAGPSVDESGRAFVRDGEILVSVGDTEVPLRGADDTRYFICQAEDDCAEVDEGAFLGEVTDGSTVRVLAPDATLLAPDLEQLPPSVWVVLEP